MEGAGAISGLEEFALSLFLRPSELGFLCPRFCDSLGLRLESSRLHVFAASASLEVHLAVSLSINKRPSSSHGSRH